MRCNGDQVAFAAVTEVERCPHLRAVLTSVESSGVSVTHQQTFKAWDCHWLIDFLWLDTEIKTIHVYPKCHFLVSRSVPCRALLRLGGCCGLDMRGPPNLPLMQEHSEVRWWDWELWPHPSRYFKWTDWVAWQGRGALGDVPSKAHLPVVSVSAFRSHHEPSCFPLLGLPSYSAALLGPRAAKWTVYRPRPLKPSAQMNFPSLSHCYWGLLSQWCKTN